MVVGVWIPCNAAKELRSNMSSMAFTPERVFICGTLLTNLSNKNGNFCLTRNIYPKKFWYTSSTGLSPVGSVSLAAVRVA